MVAIDIIKREVFGHYIKFNGFVYDDDLSALDNFIELANHMNWEKGSRKYNTVKKELYEVIGEAVNHNFDKLANLQQIIHRYQLNDGRPVPDSVTQCKAIVQRQLFVCIYDYIMPNNDTKFPSLSALSRHCIRNKQIYPLNDAKRQGNEALKILLRPIYF